MAVLSIAQALSQFPAMLVGARFAYTPDGMPFVAKKLSLRQRMNLLLCGLDMVLPNQKLFSYPPVIQVEPTNRCNLKCPLCPTGLGVMKRKQGVMSMDIFQAILDELGDRLISVILYGWGEPFLNQDLPDMIRACRKHNILTSTSTNGNTIQSMEKALDVVDAGLTGLIIAMDGSNQHIYSKYRKSGDFEKAIRCVTLIEAAKKRRNSKFPYTNIRLVVTKDNVQDIAQMEKLAQNLGVNMFSYKSVGNLTDMNQIKDYEPADESKCRFAYNGQVRVRQPFFTCTFPFRQPTVFWDGTLVGCEFDYDLSRPWGTVGKENFKEIWNNSVAMQLRSAIRRKKRDLLPFFCSRCPYQDRVHKSCILYCQELRKI